MTNEEISKWLMNLKDDIGKMRYQPLWHYAEALNMAIEALSNSQNPSVSELKTTTDSVSATDVIYRADAIDVLCETITPPSITLDTLVLRIDELPSAQPEIIRCKDCKKYDTHDHRCKHWNHGVVVMDWCSRAERRTDE